MSYVDRMLLADEKILFRTRKHTIIFLYPILVTIFVILASGYMQANSLFVSLLWVPWLITGIFWLGVGLDFITSEYAVTNHRIIMREGFFYRHANNMQIRTISQINVDQSLLGQVLGYGVVSINSFGAFDAYATIARPFLFQKYVNEQVNQA